jgi:pimeloyl-ACP methyl ester carboxylesterase
MPFNRYGRGPRPLLVIQGLQFENRPMGRFEAAYITRIYRFLAGEYTLYFVTRQPGMPPGYTLENMAGDYAYMIRDEFGGPLDVIGVSTGGSILQHLAAGYPNLLRRIVIHSSAYTLAPAGKQLQLKLARLARQGRRQALCRALVRFMTPPGRMSRLIVPVVGFVMSLSVPYDTMDLITTVDAEDDHDFKARLGEIRVPALVAGGEDDPFYTPGLFRQTADGIPGARLGLYPHVGHPASGKPFERDVLAFLRDGQG